VSTSTSKSRSKSRSKSPRKKVTRTPKGKGGDDDEEKEREREAIERALDRKLREIIRGEKEVYSKILRYEVCFSFRFLLFLW